jgi:hypothetical protein
MIQPDRSRDQTSGGAILNESEAFVNNGVKDKRWSGHTVPAEGVQRSSPEIRGTHRRAWGPRPRMPDIAVKRLSYSRTRQSAMAPAGRCYRQ